MIENGKKVPLKFYFGAPPCVPATPFETAGAKITSSDIGELFEKDNLKYLAEMMNYPGVLFGDAGVMEKIEIAKQFGKPIDGHAPSLKGDEAKKYIAAGITTDHECDSINEAYDKIKFGMKILIREGSAAKNYDELHPLIKQFPAMVMFCSDDKHPDDLIKSHIDEPVRLSVAKGYDVFDVLRVASLNPVEHYKLDVGLLRSGDNADFIVVNNLKDFKVQQTYINGELVAENGKSLIKRVQSEIINNFNCSLKKPSDFEIPAPRLIANDGVPIIPRIRVIEALNGELITNEIHYDANIQKGNLVSDVSNDILKLAVTDRYKNSKPAIGFIKNFGLKRGAIASGVGHDSHNINCSGSYR